MARAEVGDDVYGEDPTVRALEERVAGMFGKPAAIFTPTGSLANLLAVSALAGPGDEVLCEASAHIVRAEIGAHGAWLGVTTRTWSGAALDLAAIDEIFAPDLGPFLLATKVISVENTHNFRGGEVIAAADLRSLREYADRVGVAVHLDGARIWNAHAATGTPFEELGAVADTMAVCLSKGLGAPVGSLMLGTAEQVAEARVLRKRLGAGMRQVGVLAAAGLYALDHHLDRLGEDHENARLLAEALGAPAPDTNIVVVEVPDARAVVAAAQERGVLASAVGATRLRLLTHLDVSRADVDAAVEVLAPLV